MDFHKTRLRKQKYWQICEENQTITELNAAIRDKRFLIIYEEQLKVYRPVNIFKTAEVSGN